MTDYERRVATMYDGLAEQYLERIRPRQSYWAPVAAALGEVSAGTLLDVGCGPGHLTAALPPAVRVYGIDSSPEMIAAAQKARPDGIFDVRSFDAPLPDGWPAFDHVVIAGCIEFSADLVTLLGRLRAALRPGGRIIATIPEDHTARARRSTRRIRGGAELIPTQQYSFVGAAEAIEAAGLQPATYAHIPGWVDADGVQHFYGLWTLAAAQENSAASSGASASARHSSPTSPSSTSS